MTAVGEKQARRRLQVLVDHAKDPRPAFGRVATLFHRAEADLFRTRGTRKWAPLAKRTVQFKRRKGLPRQAMRRTDVLYRSLTNATAAGAVVEVQRDRVTVGTRVAHAHRAQHSGGGRKLIIVRPRDRKAYQQEISDYIGRPA